MKPARSIKAGVMGATCAVAVQTVATLVAMFVLLGAPAAQAADWSAVPARDNRGTVLIRTSWLRGDKPDTGTATGFVVTKSGHIISVAHQVPVDATAVVFTGETEGWASAYKRQTFPLKVKHLDRQADVVVFLPDKKVELTPLPVHWAWDPTENAEVYGRGFPLGGPLDGNPGHVRRSGTSPEVPTTMMLRAGHSGAPVYDAAGRVVCMVRGGHKVADVKDPDVMGQGFCVPLALLQMKLPPELVAGTTDASTTSVAIQGGGEIRVSYEVSQVKVTPFPEDPTRSLADTVAALAQPASTETYQSQVFTAEKGYRIVKYDYIEHSANQMSEPRTVIAPDGRSIQMHFKLRSGPGTDRTRGWLYATIVTTQVPKEP